MKKQRKVDAPEEKDTFYGPVRPPGNWRFLTFEGGMKPHCVPAAMLEAAVEELERRAGQKAGVRPIHRFGMDVGGMAFGGSPFDEFNLDGLELAFPCEFLWEFASQLRREIPRRFLASGQVYVKLKCHWNCLVLTPEQRDELVRLMEAASEAAEKRSNEFYARIGVRPRTA